MKQRFSSLDIKVFLVCRHSTSSSHANSPRSLLESSPPRSSTYEYPTSTTSPLYAPSSLLPWTDYSNTVSESSSLNSPNPTTDASSSSIPASAVTQPNTPAQQPPPPPPSSRDFANISNLAVSLPSLKSGLIGSLISPLAMEPSTFSWSSLQAGILSLPIENTSS